MALVPLEAARRQVLQTMKKLGPGEGLELLTYKRDRGITVRVGSEGWLEVREYGFAEREYHLEPSGLPRLLKTLIRREFPRSHKVRLSRIA